MRNVKIRATARFDRARPCEGWLTIDRERQLISARVLRSEKSWTLPLASVIDMLVSRCERGAAELGTISGRQVRRGG